MIKLNVLIVEDENHWIAKLKNALHDLSNESIAIYYAKSLVEGLRLLDERIFEVFIFDLKIPDKGEGDNYGEYNNKIGQLIDQVFSLFKNKNFDQNFLYSYCLMHEIVRTLPCYKILIYTVFNVDIEELTIISNGTIRREDLKQKKHEIINGDLKSIISRFEEVVHRTMEDQPEIHPAINEIDFYLIRYALSKFRCNFFSISRLHRGRSGARLFHVREKHSDNVKQVPEYLVKIAKTNDIKKEWENCCKILGMGNIFPNQSFSPSGQDSFISVLDYSCITYPYKSGYKTFKEFFRNSDTWNIPASQRAESLEMAVRAILTKLRLLRRLTNTAIKSQPIGNMFEIGVEEIKNVICKPTLYPIDKSEIKKLSYLLERYQRICHSSKQCLVMPIHGDFHGENVLLKAKEIDKISDDTDLEDLLEITNIIDFQSFREDGNYLNDYVRLECDIKFHLLPFYFGTRNLKKLDRIIIDSLPNDLHILTPISRLKYWSNDLCNAVTCISEIRRYLCEQFDNQKNLGTDYLLCLFITALQYIVIALKQSRRNGAVINLNYAINSASYISDKINN